MYHLHTTRAPLGGISRNIALRVKHNIITRGSLKHLRVDSSRVRTLVAPRFTAAPAPVFKSGIAYDINIAKRLRADPHARIRSTFFAKRAVRVLSNFSPARQRRIKEVLSQQQHRRRELRYYRKRPRLRLGKTRVTRRRRRKANLGLFARRSLKRPQTLAGMKNLLLPPLAAYQTAFRRAQTGVSSTDGSLRSVVALQTDDPRT